MRRIGVFLVVAALAVAGEAVAQTYAIASLIGHELSFASAYSTVETRVAPAVPKQALVDPVFDEAAIAAVKTVLRKGDANRKLVELTVSDPASIAAAKKAPSPDSAEFRAIVDTIAAVVRPHGIERLVLLVPQRHELVIRTSHGNIGIGKGAGLGLYIDKRTRLRQFDTGEVGYGLLGVFANFRIAVVDVENGRVWARTRSRPGRRIPRRDRPTPIRSTRSRRGRRSPC